MHKIISIMAIVSLFIFSVSCSKVKDTPSAIVLQYFQSIEKGDVETLKKIMTKESYHSLLDAHLDKIAGKSSVFLYDAANFRSDPESLKRVEKEVSTYLQKNKADNKIVLLSEKGVTEKERMIFFEKNGDKSELSLILNDSGKWIIK